MLRSCTYCCKLVLTYAQGNETKADPARTSGLGHPTTPNLDLTLEDTGREISLVGISFSIHSSLFEI